jgi:hypothetical protein
VPQVPLRHQGVAPPWHALAACGPHKDPLTYPFSPLHLLPPEKIMVVLSLVFLLPKLRFLISLLGAPFLKLFWGIATWYVTPPLLQLVFDLVDYILHN